MNGIIRKPSLLIILVVAGCHGAGGSRSLSGHATVDGASDSSGIVVTLAGRSSGVTRTAADGSYHFGGLAGGSYLVVASADATREHTLSATVADGQRAVPDLVFHPVGTITGRVTRAGSPAGNGGIVVLASGSSAAASSDDSGAYTLTLPPGTYDLYAFTGGFLPGTDRSLTVTRGATTTAPEIDLNAAQTSGPQPGNLSGLAKRTGLDDGSGITVTLAATTSSTMTASDGSFVLPNPPDGIYSLDFDDGDYHETVPSVLAIPAASGFYVDGSLFPLGGSTLVLPRGRRQASGAVLEMHASPRRDRVLFVKQDPPAPGATASSATLYTMPAAGGTPVAIAAQVGLSMQLSPDGTHVAYCAGAGMGCGELWTAGLDGSGATKIATSVQTFSYTPDGSHLITQGNGATGWFVIPASGGAAVALGQVGNYSTPVSVRGDAVLVLNNCSGPCDFMLVPTSGAPATKLASGVYWFRVGPALDRVLYSDGSSLFVRDLAASASTTLYTGKSGIAELTPDETQVLLELPPAGSMTPSVLSLLPATGGNATPLANDVSDFLLSPAGHVAYLEQTATSGPRTVSVPGAQVQSLDGKAAAYPAFQLSPTGRWVVLRSYTPSTPSSAIILSIAPAETGLFHEVASNVLFDTTRGHATYVFSADDSEIAYVVDDGTFASQGYLEAQPAAGGAPTRLAAGARWVQSFSPGGTQVMYAVGQTPTLWTAPAAGGTPHALIDNVTTTYYQQVTDPFFVDDATVFAIRKSSPKPFSFQDGLYRLRAN